MCVCLCLCVFVFVISLQAKAERLTEEVGKLAEDGVSVVSVNDGLTQGNSEVRCHPVSVTGAKAG